MVRKATDEDISLLKQLENECFDEHIRENFEFVLNNKNYVYFVIEEKEKIIAYAGLSISYEQGDILSVCVNKNYRNKGFAFSLIKKILEYAKENNVEKVFLEVEEDNAPAINLYKKLGFFEINRRKNYYGEKTAIIMFKAL